MTITLPPEDAWFAAEQARRLGLGGPEDYIHHVVRQTKQQTPWCANHASDAQVIAQIEAERDQRQTASAEELIEMKHAGHRY